jgi:soluble lytic murein transglycosylase-like protein
MEGKVKCSGCGWSWNKSDSSKKDMYVCHQCGKDNTMKNGGWLNKYDDGGVQPNYNDASVSMSDDFVGLGYDTSSRKFSPAWGGQFQGGGKLNPVSPMQQVQQLVQPTPTVPYLQTKDPSEFYKSWIQSPEYAKRQLNTGYSQGEDLYMPNAAASRESRLGAIEDMTPITYNTREPSKATPGVYGSPSYVNINPSDYTGTSKQAIEAHELAHVAGAMGEVRPGMMSATEQDIFKKSMLPMKEPVLSGVQGSKEREASKRNLEDFKHSQEPDEVKADLDALRFMMYDKGIYDITKGKKFTESDFEKSKQNLGKDRVFNRLEKRVGKKNFVNLMNTIALADDQEEAPIAMGGMSIPGSVGFSYARVAGAAPSEGKYAKKTMASAQNGIMSPMLLARNVLNYFYPNEETTNTVEAAPSDYKKGLTNELLQRQAYKESTFNPAAVSPAGYKGLTQIGEGVLEDYSNKKGGKKLDPFNPEDAVELQKFAMNDLYNASFINKPDQSDSVRIAKTLAAYNWGRGNLSNYLNEQKSKGVDIYDSYDWLNNLPKETSDYVNKILLQEDPSFNKNYKKASTNPKYEEVTSLYDQKKFGGDIPSAQNGQEMRFYQNGLDWKPKSMQDGGEKMYQGLELPEFVVEGKDERMKEAMSQGMANFYGYVGELMGAPQKEMMQFVTGKEQTPSEAFGFQNPGGWLDSYSSFGKNLSNFGIDAFIDPVNAIPGVGLIDDLTRGAVRGAAQDAISKTLKYGVSPYSYSPEVIARIPENLVRGALGKPKSLPKAVTEVTEKNPQAKRTIEDTYNNREDAWSVYLGLAPENKGLKLVGSDEATGLSKYELTKPRIMSRADLKDYKEVIDRSTFKTAQKQYLNLNKPGDTVIDSDKLFGVMGGYSKFISPDGKSIMYRDVWDLQPFSRFNSRELPTDMIGNAIRNFEVSSLIPGARPFVSEGKLADIKTKYYPAESYRNIQSRFNNELADVTTMYDPEGFVKDIDNPTAEEIFKYNQMVRNIAKNNLMHDIKNEKTFLNLSRYGDSRKYADFAPYIKVDKSKKKDGGIIKDNKGYWNPENWGKPVEIDSNDITMEPSPYTGVEVPYNVLGVSDTGDTKLMKPGKNYKFKGKKVREYPVGKLGINQLDAQPMKKLNQLLNFTNNPDKDNWLDKYN